MQHSISVTLFLINGLAMLAASLPRDDKCSNCLSEPSTSSLLSAQWTMPLSRLGEKQYYLGTFFKLSTVGITECSWQVSRPSKKTIFWRSTSKASVLAMNISGHRERTREKKEVSSGYRPVAR